MTYRTRALATAGALLLLVACGSSVENTGATSGMGGAGAGLPACTTEGDALSYQPYACALPAPCADPHFIGAGGAGTAHFTDPTAATCVLSKLRDRELSQLTFSSEPPGTLPGEHTYSETVFVLDASHGTSNWSQVMDTDYSGGSKNRQLLKPASYFDGCLALTDPKMTNDCLAAWSDGCDDVAVTCPAK